MMKIKNLVILFFLLQLYIFQTLVIAKTPTTLPISISPIDIHSPFFQTLNHESAVFDYVNYEIAQDSEGFLWFAGYGGLVRYDGYELRTFNHDVNDKHSIAENAIRTITADNHSGLWVSLYNLGLSYYNAKNKQFTHYPHDENNPNSPSSNTIRDIIVLENDDLWIGGRGGLSYYNNKTKTFTHFVSGTDIKNDNYILDMTIDTSGKLWLSTAKGLKVFDAVKKKLIVPALSNKNGHPITQKQQSALFRKLITTQDGNIWLAGYHENIHVLNPQSMEIFALPAREGGGKYNHMTINQVNSKEIWVSNLSTGIEVFNVNTFEKINHIAANNKNDFSLKRINVDVIFTDSAGITWLSFFGEKPQYFNQNLSAFKYLQFDKSNTGEGIVRVKPINEDKLLISNAKALSIFDKKTSTLNKLNFPSSTALTERAWEVSELTFGKKNEVWIGTTITQLIKFNLVTNEESHYSFEGLGTKGNSTYGVNYISEDEILVLTSGGAISFNPKTEKFSPLKMASGENITARMWESYKSKEGHYFLSSNEGLFYQLAKQKGFTLLPLNKSTFKGSSVEVAAADKYDRIWVFTNQALYQAEIKNNKISLLEIPQPAIGLPIDRIAITIDEQGFLWLGPYVYYNPQSKEYVNLSHYNYIKKSAFNHITSFGDTLYASSDKEMLIIDKTKIRPLNYRAPIQLTEFNSSEITMNEQDLAAKVIISANTQEFSAKFAALDFAHASNTVYQYRLKGLDDFWRKASSDERRATYTSLPPGNFVLEIKAQHQSGIIQHKTLTIPLTVLPKIYQTWWFIGLLAILAVMLLWLIHKLFLQRAIFREQELNTHKLALERAEMMEELVLKKNQLLADVSHELSTPLTVLKLQVESLKDDLEDDVQVTYQALDNKLDDIQHLIDDIHQLAQSDVGALQLNIQSFELNEALDLWQAELSQFINSNKLSFTFIRELPKELIVDFDRDRIKQIFINLLTNCIKYTHKPGAVQLRAKVENSSLVFTIEDSAPGVSHADLSNIFERLYRVENSRSRETGGSGLGLSICKSLITEHKGTIHAENSTLGGIKICIELPITLLTTA